MKLIQVIDYSAFGDRCFQIAENSAKYADMLWFRIKNVSSEVIAEEALKLRKLLPDTFIILSADAKTAHETGMNGVQLGVSTETADVVRSLYPELTIGYSAHSTDEIMTVDADHYTLSPVFFTQKDYEVIPLGAEDITHLNRSVYALGGISMDNIEMLKGKGYAGIAGISFYKELKDLKKVISTW